SWRNNLKEFHEKYETSILEISKKLIKKGFKVVLMSFCQKEGDEEAITRIKNKVTNENITSYLYRGDLEEALSVLKSSKSVIATRFHSLILGLLFKKPVFPFIYSGKTRN